MKICTGCLINDFETFNKNLGMSFQYMKAEYDLLSLKHFIVKNPTSATKGLNKLLSLGRNEEFDAICLFHQDVIFPSYWFQNLIEFFRYVNLNELGCIGLWGANENGVLGGNIIDTGEKRDTIWAKMLSLPFKAICLDECCIAINLKTEFIFDEVIDGFDLYGTDVCLNFSQKGYLSLVIDNPIIHNSKRGYEFIPDEIFMKNWN